MILPGGANAQVRIRVVGLIVVDVEAIRIEIADVNELAVRRPEQMCFVPSVITEDCPKTLF